MVSKLWIVLVIKILGMRGMIFVIVIMFWFLVIFSLVNIVVILIIIVDVINFEKNLICIYFCMKLNVKKVMLFVRYVI